MATGFPYDTAPLNASILEIRVIELEALWDTIPDDSLHFKVKRISLKGPLVPCYCSISYTWGDSSDRRSIHLNGYKVSVPRNTFEALERLCLHNPRYSMRHHFRRRRYTVPLWIDAICINQHDIEERNQQIAMMDKIYGSAHEVLVWLGQGNGREGETFAEIGKVLDWHDWVMKDRRNRGSCFGASRSRCGPSTSKVELMRCNGPSCGDMLRSQSWHSNKYYLNDRQWYLFEDLFDDPWFTRLWVLQEVALAKPTRRMFYRGTASIDGNRVTQFARLLIDANYTKHSGFRSRGVLSAHVLHDLCHTSGRRRRFLEHLLLSVTFDCSDPRDKVYALLGLLSPWERRRLQTRAPIQPDYRKTVAAVYRDATRAAILEHKDLSLLQLAGHRIARTSLMSVADRKAALRASNHELPSWVPNLEVPSHSYGTPLILAEHGPRKVKLRTCTASCNLVDPNVLGLRGVLVDVISHTWPAFHYEPSENPEALSMQLRKLLRSICRFLHIDASNEANAPILGDICVTLACGRTPQNTNAAQDTAFMEDVTDFLLDFADIEWARSQAAQAKLPPSISDLWERTYFKSNCLFSQAVRQAKGRSFYYTRQGFMGMGLAAVNPGDAVCHLFGAEMFVILRRRGEGSRLMGDAYVHRLADCYDPRRAEVRCFHIV